MPRARRAHLAARRVDRDADHRHEVPAGELAERDLVRLREELARSRDRGGRASGRRTSRAPCPRWPRCRGRWRRRARRRGGRPAGKRGSRRRRRRPRRARRTRRRRRPRAPRRPAAREAEATAASCRRNPSAAGRAARCRSRAPPAPRRRAPSPLPPRRSRRAGSSETTVSVASSSAGVAIGTTTAVEPCSRNGTSSSYDDPRRRALLGIENEWLSHPEEPAAREASRRPGLRQKRPERLCQPLVCDMARTLDELVARARPACG